jgi:peptidoglycan/xylan/chitin deacetylase (PgdA/CDA1 family)
MEKEIYIDRYAQIRNRSIKGVFRNIALDCLSLFDEISGRSKRALMKNRIQFLCLHHVFKDEEMLFRRLLKDLLKDHTFIGYGEAVKKIEDGTINKPYLAISFDDGMKNCLKAAEIMDKFGVKACFFICPSIIGEKDYDKIKKFCGDRIHKPPVEFLDWNDVEHLLSGGHEIGGHTMTHCDLSKLTAEQARDEIKGAYDTLKKKAGKVRHFSWPFGRFKHFSAVAVKTVFDSGFISCASAERGCHIFRQEKDEYLSLRRHHILAGWPARHIKHFMTENSLKSAPADNRFIF